MCKAWGRYGNGVEVCTYKAACAPAKVAAEVSITLTMKDFIVVGSDCVFDLLCEEGKGDKEWNGF